MALLNKTPVCLLDAIMNQRESHERTPSPWKLMREA
jgi:hypothetical protein